jgi:peptidyl-prolyl cis-trans isomerase SurA
MKLNSIKNSLVVLMFLVLPVLNGFSQKLVDGIIAVVGDEIILRSDLENQKIQAKAQGVLLGENVNCVVMEDLLYEKLLLHQGGIDSVEVSEAQIQSELDKRINVFIEQIGSREKLEEYYGKSINEIKSEFYDVLKNQMIVRNVQYEITKDVNITPSQVHEYFISIPEDSLPLINAEVEVAHIVKFPPENYEETRRIKKRLQDFKDEVLAGKDFATLAVFYSEDPGSAVKGGELGMQSRGTFVSEFDAVALSLKEGQISDPFKTQYGYHIMQLMEKQGEKYSARHILLKPKVSQEDLQKAKTALEEVYNLIKLDSLTFEQAAVRHSDDEESKNQNGNLVNYAIGTTRFEMSQLDPQIFLTIDTMKVGQMSRPAFMQTRDGKKAYRIIKLKTRTEAHRANMVDDYQIIQEAARSMQSGKAIQEWIENKISITYIRMDDEFRTCPFEYKWNKIQ